MAVLYYKIKNQFLSVLINNLKNDKIDRFINFLTNFEKCVNSLVINVNAKRKCNDQFVK